MCCAVPGVPAGLPGPVLPWSAPSPPASTHLPACLPADIGAAAALNFPASSGYGVPVEPPTEIQVHPWHRPTPLAPVTPEAQASVDSNVFLFCKCTWAGCCQLVVLCRVLQVPPAGIGTEITIPAAADRVGPAPMPCLCSRHPRPGGLKKAESGRAHKTSDHRRMHSCFFMHVQIGQQLTHHAKHMTSSGQHGFVNSAATANASTVPASGTGCRRRRSALDYCNGAQAHHLLANAGRVACVDHGVHILQGWAGGAGRE